MVFFYLKTEHCTYSEHSDITVHAEGLPALEHALFDAIPDAVHLIDPVTSNIMDCNQHAYEDLYLTRVQALNHSVLSLQIEVRGLPAWTEIAEVIRQNRVYRFQGRHRRGPTPITRTLQPSPWNGALARDIQQDGKTAIPCQGRTVLAGY